MNLLWLKMQSVRYGLTPLELQWRTPLLRFGGFFFVFFSNSLRPAAQQCSSMRRAGMTAGTWALNVSSNSFLIQKHFLWEREMRLQNTFLHPPCWYYCTLSRKPSRSPPPPADISVPSTGTCMPHVKGCNMGTFQIRAASVNRAPELLGPQLL